MNRIRRIGIIIAVFVSPFFIFSQTVYASVDVDILDQAAYVYYIDAGTGSIIIQVLIGVAAGGLAMIGIYRVRLRNFLINLFKKRKHDEESK